MLQLREYREFLKFFAASPLLSGYSVFTQKVVRVLDIVDRELGIVIRGSGVRSVAEINSTYIQGHDAG
jgi:hypothetical protein